ncbi:MAG: hypothetical protein JO166_04155 [Deltaproteobacteria bacterium]|nr:hypothetical protein [Deltaproteobacteria bacterium]
MKSELLTVRSEIRECQGLLFSNMLGIEPPRRRLLYEERVAQIWKRHEYGKRRPGYVVGAGDTKIRYFPSLVWPTRGHSETAVAMEERRNGDFTSAIGRRADR